MNGNIKSIKKITRAPVFNMTVEDVHNYMIKGNVIVKNCDSLRSFCVWWSSAADKDREDNRKVWSADRLEDYYNANEEDRQYLIRRYGEPIL